VTSSALVILLVVPAALVSFAAHELGHLLAWKTFGVRHKRFVFHWRRGGIGVEYDADRRSLSRWQQFAGAAGGPMANLLLAAALWRVAPLLASGSLELGLFNLLLPVRGSDSRWMLRSLRHSGHTRLISAESRSRLPPRLASGPLCLTGPQGRTRNALPELSKAGSASREFLP
jgi:hypothetical protein